MPIHSLPTAVCLVPPHHLNSVESIPAVRWVPLAEIDGDGSVPMDLSEKPSF